MINCIVYSKDRPSQLSLLLRSIHRNAYSVFDNITVIYTASESGYAQGYAKLEATLVKQPIFKQEISLVKDTMEMMEGYAQHKNSLLTFLTDDSVFYRNFNDQKMVIEHCLTTGNDICCFSLRLGENTTETTYYLPGNHVELRATKVGNICKWRHAEYGASHGFGYPLSLDGHVFRSSEITKIVKQVGDFQGVNSLEGSMSRFVGELSPCMAAFNKSVLVTVPVNRVQNACPNTAGVYFGRSPKELNDKFLDGYEIDYDSIDFSKVNGTHNELDYKYKRM